MIISEIISFLHSHLVPLGGLGVFIASFIEEAIVIVPAATVVITSGFLFLSERTGFNVLPDMMFKIVLPSAIGILIGTFVVYGLAYLLGKKFIERWGRYLGLRWEEFEKFERWFEKGRRDDIFIFVSRSIPLIPSVAISAFCGLMRLNITTYIVYSFFGIVVRSTILALIGWQIGNLYWRYESIVSRFENILLFALVFIVFAGLMYRRSIGRAKINTQ